MNTVGLIAKEIVKAAANYGIGYMAGEVVKSLTPENVSTAKKVCMGIGGVAVAGYAGVKAGEYIDDVADAIEETAKEVKKLVKAKKSTKEEKKDTDEVEIEAEEA